MTWQDMSRPGCDVGRYEAKLTAERDMGLRLKGENGIMKKRFSALQKDIDEAREECKALFDQKKELYQVRTEQRAGQRFGGSP